MSNFVFPNADKVNGKVELITDVVQDWIDNEFIVVTKWDAKTSKPRKFELTQKGRVLFSKVL